MSAAAIMMMTVVCSLVWGGFLVFLAVVWRIEKRKRKDAGQGERASRS
jgi:hypothetical protein